MDLKPEVLLDTLNTNVVGTLRVTQAFAPLLARSSEPRIINVSSGAGQLDGEPQAWAPAYCISKTAVNMLTQQLTAALPDVMVNSMCPGWCRTEMGGSDAPRTPDEGADTLVWLALDAPHDLRGQFIKDRQVIQW
jgi:NAD(P)-dependent dehydrogenase (short-subunit alcohol dehydrogenase family)